MTRRSVVHIEIPVADRQAASQFYQEVFGWDQLDHLPIDYTYAQMGNASAGYPGLSLGSWKPGDVILYVESADIDADLKAIEARGGKVLIPRTPIPGRGWFAWFIDPTGNKLALFTDAPSGGSSG